MTYLAPLRPCGLCTKVSASSLCNLLVLCASVVSEFAVKVTTEAQRTQRLHREIKRPALFVQRCRGESCAMSARKLTANDLRLTMDDISGPDI